MNATAAETSWPERIFTLLARHWPGSKPDRKDAVSQPGQPAFEATDSAGVFCPEPSGKPAGVLLPPQPGRGPKPLNILVPVDFSPASSRALDCALEMAVSHRTSITLLHAIHLNLAPLGPANPAQHKISLCHEALAKAGPFLERARERGIVAACLVDEGAPAKAILGAARRCRPDVIILSKRRRGKWTGWLGAGTVERVAGEAGCPVLVLPG
jgi:nucleotide-binding universal stress UspA family protein